MKYLSALLCASGIALTGLLAFNLTRVETGDPLFSALAGIVAALAVSGFLVWGLLD